MIESNIHEGNQSSEQPRSAMKHGVSVTDACISWETTDALLREIHKDLTASWRRVWLKRLVMVAELTALRDQIDEVDKALLDLLARRMALVAEVGEVKANTACRFMYRSVKLPCWRPAVKRPRRWAFLRI
jgi:hypothetical protein